jgi:hypothetical protein
MNSERKQANDVGRRLALKSSIIGLIIGYIIMAMLHYTLGFFGAAVWIFNHGLAPYLLVSAVGIVIFSFIFGSWSGRQILLNNRNPTLIGVFSGFMAVWGATLVGGLLGYFTGAGDYAQTLEAVQVFIYDPLYWVTLVGAVPIIIMGYLYGREASAALS